ncbi:MAG: hypothetical protein HZC55_04280 [Verrucomicrobia bacterium]|nr:hypothetical protein [Verrucomicrobiota bacterium]
MKSKRAAPVFTNLGMYFVDAGVEIVLVQVEVNVRGLLAVHARRLIKSKRGAANLSRGTVRMSIASAGDQERAARARETAEELSALQHQVAELQLSLALATSKATARTCHRA